MRAVMAGFVNVNVNVNNLLTIYSHLCGLCASVR